MYVQPLIADQNCGVVQQVPVSLKQYVQVLYISYTGQSAAKCSTGDDWYLWNSGCTTMSMCGWKNHAYETVHSTQLHCIA